MGIYDTVEIYSSKQERTPLATLRKGVYKKDIIDVALKGDDTILSNRNVRILEMAEDGSQLKMWISAAMDFHDATLWHPKSLLTKVVDNVG